MSRIYTFTTLVHIDSGLPTWWKPDFGIERTNGILHVRAGWLRLCIQIGFRLKRVADQEAS